MATIPRSSPVEKLVEKINAVKTPLNYLVLGLLMVEMVIVSLIFALPEPEYRGPLVWTVIISIPFFMLTVVSLAVFLPEALTGDRPLQEETAHRLASDLYLALDGSLRNLEPDERAEAWIMVADVIVSDPKAGAAHVRFCTAIAIRLRQLASLGNRPLKKPGPIHLGVQAAVPVQSPGDQSNSAGD